MRLFRTLALALALSPLSLPHAAEPAKATDYTATVNGVVCAACKAHVTIAFKKLPGVDAVSFAKGDKEGVVTVTFNSTASLTKEDAVKVLGDDAKIYEVLSLEKAK